MKVQEVFSEKWQVASFAMQSFLCVGSAMCLICNFLEELFPTSLTFELLLPCVQQGVSLEARGVGECLGALLTYEGPQGALLVIVKVGGEISGQHLLPTHRTRGLVISLLWTFNLFTFADSLQKSTHMADYPGLSISVDIANVIFEIRI